MIGKLLRGHYQIVRFLGGGGGGETYIAVDTDRPGQPQCVVKRLRPASDEPNFLPLAKKLFKREAETLEQLGKHDQIPRLLAYFEEEGEFYLVQDFIEGQPLSVELPSGRCWSETKIIRLLDDILRILEFVHGQGAIHRDLKPANLIRRHEDGKIVLIDFGAVKQISQNPQTQATPITISIGTQGYMSSEQVRGRPRPSSDIYSLGMIGIQALTGIDPIRLVTDRDGEVIWQHYVPVSDELAAVLTKMVREHFRDRYESVAEVLQALKPLIDQRLGGQSDDSATQHNKLNAGVYSNSRFEQETKIPASYEDQFSYTKVTAADSALEPRETKVVSSDELAANGYTSSISESRATKFETASTKLQESREPAGCGHQLADFRDFSTRNSSLVLTAGGLTVITLIALIWVLLNPVKQQAPVVKSLQAPPSESSPSQTSESSVVEASASQEIYAELEQYLQQKNWKAADRETYEVMLKIAGPKSTETGELDVDEWDNLACRDFQEIDSLWRKASEGRLGFSVQLELFRITFKQVTGKDWEPESEGKADDEDKIAIRRSSSVYFDKIGWRPLGETWKVQWKKPSGANRYQYIPGKEPDFANPSVGQLPAILPWSDGQDYRLQKASACKL